jgi:hypothetical protein
MSGLKKSKYHLLEAFRRFVTHLPKVMKVMEVVFKSLKVKRNLWIYLQREYLTCQEAGAHYEKFNHQIPALIKSNTIYLRLSGFIDHSAKSRKWCLRGGK